MAKHIVIDARIRRASTGRPIDRLLQYLPDLDQENNYTVLVEPDDPWRPVADNFQVKSCSYKQFSFNPLQQVTFSWLLHRLKPDLVYFTLTGQQPLFYFGRQVTLTHDLTMYEYVRPGRLPVWLHKLRMRGYHLLMWSAHRKAAHIIVPSEYVHRGLVKFHPFTEQKITTIYEASEPPIATKAEPLPSVKKPFIFHVGSPFPHKNIERLVEAFEKLAVKYPDLQLVLGGKKEFYFEQLQKQIDASSVAKRIVVTGFVSSGQLKWLYQNASCYVLPSLSEGFGLPGLEALVHGCPLASSNATCLPEIYGEAAHYFDPRSVDNIVQKVSDLLDSQQLRDDLIEKGHTQTAKYSWLKMTEETFDIFKKLI